MKKWLTMVAAPVFAVAGLSGCAHSGSTAAIVNGVEIPDSRIVEYSEGCAAALGQTNPGMVRFDMVQWAVLGEMSNQYLAEHPDQRPSEDELLAYAQQHPTLHFAVQAGSCREAALLMAQHQVLALDLGGRAGDYIQGNQVQLNPRYGSWNSEDQQPDPLASLSELAES